MSQYDLIVIGGGPAGYVGAIRAAQLGKKVACIENDRAGGTCLNWGCIPTKALLKNAELYATLKEKAGDFGLSFDNLSYDWSKVIGRSRKVADKLAGGIEFLFKKNKVDYLRGTGALAGTGKVTVTAADGTVATHEAKHVLLATGCRARDLPFLKFDGKRVLGAREAMLMPEQPRELLIIGAGAIGVEFAYFYNAYGTRVTIVEMMDHLLPVEDTEISQALEKSFKKQGIQFHLATKTTAAQVTEAGVELTVEPVKGGAPVTLKGDACLVAVGVGAILPGGTEKLELTERGFVKTNDRYQTNLPGVSAAGDLIGPPWLAHVASFEAIHAVESMFDPQHKSKKVEIFPGCTYCHPEVASIGLTERACKEKGIAYKVGKFPFQASGRALAAAEPEGFVKLIYGEQYGELLGAHIIGAEATELIAEMGLAITLEATHEELENTIHAHPTLSEAIHEATSDAFGHAIHI
ncbi:MAG: dihydrolipoyl dehydrogenase [Verrucomicrobiales bacterium]|nr:dihydrolipoyl dehydrogenase [Verrucomicrobiales bacterium]